MSEMVERLSFVLQDWRQNGGSSSECARAVLEAMREPTEAQLHAARDWAIQKYGRPIGDDGARGCFMAMIDEALK